MARAWLAALFALGACGFEVGGSAVPGDAVDAKLDAAPPAPWFPGFTKRKAIDLAGGQTELVDFVASIASEADAELAGALSLVFTAADGVTALPVEIVRFDRATGRLEAAVRVTLAAGTKTRVYLYYGDGTGVVTALPWGPLFAGAWHMGAAGATNEIVADAKRLHDATATPSDIPLVVAGIVGDARQYDGINDSMAITDPPDGSLDFGTTSFTVGLWVKVDQSAGPWDMPLFKGGSNASAAGYDMELGTGAWLAGFGDGMSTQITPAFGQEVDLLHQWHYLVSQCDRAAGKVRTFLDGAMVDELAFPRGSVSSGYYVRFGDPIDEFKGQLDEIRIYTAAISADWIATEYANLAKRAQFQTIGPAESRQ